MSCDCESFEQRHLELLLRELRSTEHNQLQVHLQSCGACRNLLKQTHALLESLSALRPLPASEDRRREVMRRIGPQAAAVAISAEIARSDSGHRPAARRLPLLFLGLLVAGGMFAAVASGLFTGPDKQDMLALKRSGVEGEASVEKQPKLREAATRLTRDQRRRRDLDAVGAMMAGRPVHPDLKPIELGTAEPAAERLTREISWLTTELNRSPIAVMAVLTRAKPTMTGTLRDVVLDFGGAVSIRMMALKVLAGWRVLEASSAAVGLLEGTATPPPLSQLAVRVHAALISGPQAQSARLFALRDSTVAKQLARALGLQGQRSVIDHFDLQFRSGSRIGHRMLSAQVLLASPAPRARQSLEHMLVSGEAEIFRFRLLQLLISEKQYWLAILQSLALNDDSAPLRTLAIRALARSEAKRSELAAFMIDRLREARSADEICESLIFLGSGKEIELKRELTMLAAGSMIQQLAFLRSSKTGKAFTKEIERLAGEGAESVRKEAIFKLGRMGRSRKLLSRMVRDDEPLAGAAALALHLQGVRTSHFQLAMEQLLDTQITVSQLSGWTVEGLQGYLQKRWRIQLTLSGEQASSRLTDELRLPPKITIKIGALLSSFVEQHGLRYEVVENGVKVQ